MRGRMAGMKQFSVRDLLFLVVIAALVLGWWTDKRVVPARFSIGGGANHVVILDTVTGQVWEKSSRPSDGMPMGETSGFLQPKVR